MRNIKVIEGLPFSVPEIVDITDQLPRKKTWEELKKQNLVRNVWDGTFHIGLRRPEDIDTIVIHHSGSPEGTLLKHAEYHKGKWGAGIAYHISIDEMQIKQVNNLLSFTFHAGGNNTYTIGIEVNRDLTKSDLTSRERELLYAAILTVKKYLPIKYILGHNEVPENKTTCPGTAMSRIRKDIQDLEMELAYKQTPNAGREAAVRVMARLNEMYTNLNHPEYGPEAGRKFMLVDGRLSQDGIYPK